MGSFVFVWAIPFRCSENRRDLFPGEWSYEVHLKDGLLGFLLFGGLWG